MKNIKSEQISKALSSVSAAFGSGEERNQYFLEKLQAAEERLASQEREKNSFDIRIAPLKTLAWSALPAAIGATTALSAVGDTPPAAPIIIAGVTALAVREYFAANKTEKSKLEVYEAGKNVKNSDPYQISKDAQGGIFKRIVDNISDKVFIEPVAVKNTDLLKKAIENNDVKTLGYITDFLMSDKESPRFTDYLARKGFEKGSPANEFVVTLAEYREKLIALESASSNGGSLELRINDTGTSAFIDLGKSDEIARIIKEQSNALYKASPIEVAALDAPVKDANGNPVGTIKFVSRDELANLPPLDEGAVRLVVGIRPSSIMAGQAPMELARSLEKTSVALSEYLPITAGRFTDSDLNTASTFESKIVELNDQNELKEDLTELWVSPI